MRREMISPFLSIPEGTTGRTRNEKVHRVRIAAYPPLPLDDPPSEEISTSPEQGVNHPEYIEESDSRLREAGFVNKATG